MRSFPAARGFVAQAFLPVWFKQRGTPEPHTVEKPVMRGRSQTRLPATELDAVGIQTRFHDRSWAAALASGQASGPFPGRNACIPNYFPSQKCEVKSRVFMGGDCLDGWRRTKWFAGLARKRQIVHLYGWHGRGRTRSLPITSGFYGCGEGFANPVNADRQGGVQEGETDQAFCRRAQLMLMRVSQMTPRPTQRRMPRWPL